MSAAAHASPAVTVVADHTQTGRAVFQVDGQPFPWWLSEEGPTAKRIADNLYEVRVAIFVVRTPNEGTDESFLVPDFHHSQPVICGIEFPWLITGDGYTFKTSRGEVSTVELAFFTQSIEGFTADPADLPEDGKVWDYSGQLRYRAQCSTSA